jgi:hypothetical protein
MAVAEIIAAADFVVRIRRPRIGLHRFMPLFAFGEACSFASYGIRVAN